MLRPDATSSNYEVESPRWGAIDRGTLKINPDMKDKSLEAILEDADLAFGVLTSQNTYKSAVSGLEYPSKGYTVYRVDNDTELGFGFTEKYNEKSYISILEAVFGDLKQLGGIPTRAVNFNGGRRAAIQFIFPEVYYVADRAHGTFYNLYAAHDGTLGVGANGSDVCIVCGNTFRRSYNDKRLKATFKHTTSLDEKLAGLRHVFTFLQEDNKYYYPLMQEAAQKKVSDGMVSEFLLAMIPDGKTANIGPSNRRDDLQEAINITLGESNKGPDNMTIYDVFQGALRYTSYKAQKRDNEEQVAYVLEGPGEKLNDKAYAWLKDSLS